MKATRGRPYEAPNGAIVHAIDEARWRLIQAEEDERKCMERLGRAYAAVKSANAEISGAIAELTRIQHALGDTELTERETSRVEELTVSSPAVLVASLAASVAESKHGNGQTPVRRTASA